MSRARRAVAGLAALALAVGLAACAPGAGGLTAVGASEPGAPRITGAQPAGRPGLLDPAGGEAVEVLGQGFAPGVVVWLGDALVHDVEVDPEGTRLVFRAPPTRGGARLDLGVGRVDSSFADAVLQRSVLEGAIETSGLSRRTATLLAVGVVLLALAGAPLHVVATATLLLGWALTAQLRPGGALLLGPGGAPGLATDLLAWVGPLGESQPCLALALFTFAGALLAEGSGLRRLEALGGSLGPRGAAAGQLLASGALAAFAGPPTTSPARGAEPGQASGAPGLLLPPAAALLVAAAATGLDGSRLLLAGLLPGLAVGLLSLAAALAASPPTTTPAGPGPGSAGWELLLLALVAGGLLWGRPGLAEVGAAAALLALLVAGAVRGEVAPAALPAVAARAAATFGAWLLVLTAALALTSWLAAEDAPRRLLLLVEPLDLGAGGRTLLLAAALLVVGWLAGVAGGLLVLAPLLQAAAPLGLDPYHLTVVALLALEAGAARGPQRAAALGARFAGLVLVALLTASSLGLASDLPALELDPARLELAPGEERTLAPRLRLGGVDRAEAERRVQRARDELQGVEARAGRSVSALEAQLAAARARLERATSPVERAAAEQLLDEARAGLAPLAPARRALDEAELAAAELEHLARTLRWRRGGVESVGPTLSTSALPAGEHLVTVTARDARGHVARAQVVVLVPGPAR